MVSDSIRGKWSQMNGMSVEPPKTLSRQLELLFKVTLQDNINERATMQIRQIAVRQIGVWP